MKPDFPSLDRRTLLIGGGIGIGLVVAFVAWPRQTVSPLMLGDSEEAFGAFLKIGRNGRVTVAVPQVETGQGVWTALPQILVDELGAAWETVAVEPAPVGGPYANPLAEESGWLDGLGTLRRLRLDDGAMRITAGSTSISAFYEPYRRAGSAARALLVAAATERWNVDSGECDASGGFVTCGNRRAAFGELVERAAQLETPADQPLRSTGERLVGQALPRLDLPPKSDGSFRFAADVRLPDLVYASARLAPHGGRVSAFTQGAARQSPGVRQIIATDEWVVAVADTWWSAERALAAADVRVSAPERADAAALQLLLEDALDNREAEMFSSVGDYIAATEGSRPLTATYSAAATPHHVLEQPSVTVRLRGDHAEVWAATQAPRLARHIAASAAGMAEGAVTLYPMPVGDPGGGALDADLIPVAIDLAKRLDRPVQLSLSPATGHAHDNSAPASLARISALPNPSGGLTAWRLRIATADGLGSALAQLTGAGGNDSLDATALSGSVPPYAIPNVRIDGVPVPMPFLPGYMRGEPQRTLSFFTESFIDELARIAGSDPLSYRMAMLGQNPRLARCLSEAAARGGWDGGGGGSTMGLAAVSAYGSHIALLAEARIGEGQHIVVDRLVAAIDCGKPINPGLIAQQIEGGLIWGLGQATAVDPEFSAGMLVASSIGSRNLPRIGDTPRIEVHLVHSSEAPGGISGLGAAVVAPAVANAIAAGSGKRLRRLPLDPGAAA